MPVYKDTERNTWFVKFSYTDWNGKNKVVKKRGFQQKRQAENWEREYKLKLDGDTSMLFKDFIDIYKSEYLSRLRKTTFEVKTNIINNYIVPFFGEMSLNEISASDIIIWQNGLLRNENGKNLSQSYLATVHAILSAIFNYACKHYHLESNPAYKAGRIGSLKRVKDDFWTTDQYESFIDAVGKDSPIYYPFEMLYWSGIRTGELLALTTDDFDFSHDSITVSKTLHKIKGEVINYPPKTQNGYRIVKIPHTLSVELKAYIEANAVEKHSTVFKCNKSELRAGMDKATKKANLPRIRLHDLRHSHVSLLLKLHYSPVAIGERMGHSSAYITLRYAHGSQETQKQMAESLNDCMN